LSVNNPVRYAALSYRLKKQKLWYIIIQYYKMRIFWHFLRRNFTDVKKFFHSSKAKISQRKKRERIWSKRREQKSTKN
jgi:hypothetical protein